MRLLPYLIIFAMLLSTVFSAPRKYKYNKVNHKCPQCRLKGKNTYSPVCGILDGKKGTFDSEFVLNCFSRCRKVEIELLYDGECQPETNNPTDPPKTPVDSKNLAVVPKMQTREQCLQSCNKTIPQERTLSPYCEGDAEGWVTKTYPYEALLDCYISCPENTLRKLHKGPCHQDKNNPIYRPYARFQYYFKVIPERYLKFIRP